MPARPVRADNLPDRLPPVVVLVGDEDLLIDRAVAALSEVAARSGAGVQSPTRLQGGDIEGAELHEILGPSLFGEDRLVVIHAAQDVRKAAWETLGSYVREPVAGVTLVLQHAGGAKGKAILEAARAVKALEIGCAKSTRPGDRVDFVRSEVRTAGGRITSDAAEALIEAVGNDLRELAAATAQLVGDCGGAVDVDAVRAYYRGRAEVTGWSVSEQVMAGNADAAYESLRHALAEGVPHVLIADALFDGVHTLARVASAGRGDPYELSRTLRLPAWKVRKAQGQMRGWDEPGVRRAMGVVAALNADVKGVAADAGYALERGVRILLGCRRTAG